MPNIFCELVFESLPDIPVEKAKVLWDAEETFWLFYPMVENIMTAKDEEKAREGDWDLPAVICHQLANTTRSGCQGSTYNY